MEARLGDRQLIKEINLALVLNYIRRHEPASRVEVADGLGLGRSTITGAVRALMAQGLIEAVPPGHRLPRQVTGRYPQPLQLRAGARYVAGVKLAGDAVTVALCDLRATVVDQRRLPLAADPNVLLPVLRRVIAELLAAVGAGRGS